MKRKLLIAAVILLVVVAGAAGYVAWQARQTSPPASVADALRSYRADPGDQGGTPRPGVYDYRVHGSECAGLGPLKFCRTLPPRAAMIVTRHGSQLTFELRLSADHIEAQRYDERPDGRYLTWQRAFIRFAGIGQDDRTPTVPPTLALPADPHVGQRWTQQFMAEQLPVAVINVVSGHAALDIGGTTVQTFVIDASNTTGGAHPGTERDRSWHDMASGLDVRLQVARNIGGVFPYTLNADATLLDLEPAR
jgi:hypothetical protein